MRFRRAAAEVAHAMRLKATRFLSRERACSYPPFLPPGAGGRLRLPMSHCEGAAAENLSERKPVQHDPPLGVSSLSGREQEVQAVVLGEAPRLRPSHRADPP